MQETDQVVDKKLLSLSETARIFVMPTQQSVLATHITVEGFADATLFVTVTIPAALFLITVPFCSGWNEWSMARTCQPAFLEGIYNILNPAVLMIAFIIAFIIAPIILTAALVSAVAKVRKYLKGYRPRTVWMITQETIALVPFLVVFYLIYVFTVSV